MSRRTKALVLAAFLFAVNLWIVRELLTAEFIDHMYSIEGTHISIARFARRHWPDLDWFPLWYGGIPYPNTYPPLHPLLVAAEAKLLGLTPALAYHAATAIFYSLGPVTLFWLALRLSGSLGYSCLAALLYSLTSPSAFLIRIVRWDVGGVWHARRLQSLVHYGEGPHIAAMALVPVALVLLIMAFEKRRPVWWIAAALGLIAAPLTNWIGAFVLVFVLAAWLLAKDSPFRWRDWLTVAALGVYGYLLVCPWMPPSTVLCVTGNEGGSPAAGRLARFACALAGVLAYALLLWLLRRYKPPVALRFSLLFLLPMAWLALWDYWAGIHLVAQAHRCHLEMEMAIALTAAFGLKLVLDATSPRVRTAVVCVLVVLLGYCAVKYRVYARKLDRPIDIHQRIEYREAQWFEKNMRGHRVFGSGSVGFFLNVFTDVPQFSGGFIQGAINPLFDGFNYQIMSGENAGAREGEVAAIALKAFGVDAISVSGPHSQEPYKPFRNPKKFDGVLPELWRGGVDDVIYRVPRRSTSLAHVIRPRDLPTRRPIHGLDVDPIRPYVAALDDPSLPTAEMTWRNEHAARISTRMQKDQVLSVQISYHPGWNASVNGERRRTYGDHLGQLVIDPACDGACTVDLTYDGGIEMRIVRIISLLALAAAAYALLRAVSRPNPVPLPDRSN
jgi:hypothetical protein